MKRMRRGRKDAKIFRINLFHYNDSDIACYLRNRRIFFPLVFNTRKKEERLEQKTRILFLILSFIVVYILMWIFGTICGIVGY